MAEKQEPPWTWQNVRKRFEELEKRIAILEGNEEDEPEEQASAKRQPRRK